MITYSTPHSSSMSAAISPVKAPFASKCTFCAPIFTFVPLAAATAAWMSTKGTQRTVSQPSLPATRAAVSLMAASAAEGVIFIFQLPAMMVFLVALFIGIVSVSKIVGTKAYRRAKGTPVHKSSEITCPAGKRYRAAPDLRGTRGMRRRRWRCGSSSRHSPASQQPLRSHRRR